VETFASRLAASIAKSDSLACVGLDPPADLLTDSQSGSDPEQIAQLLTNWGIDIIRQTHQFVCAFKPNLAFYEAFGSAGVRALEATMRYLNENHPDIITIGDAKRGDIGSTSQAHAKYLLDHLNFDAVTLNPYLGIDALSVFLERADKGGIVVCRTSNPSADDFQMLELGGRPLWQHVLLKAATEWNRNANCLAVIGATRPDNLRQARKIAGEHFFFLVPGVGAQGGDVQEAVKAGGNQAGSGVIITSSRSILGSPAEAAAQLRSEINQARPRLA